MCISYNVFFHNINIIFIFLFRIFQIFMDIYEMCVFLKLFAVFSQYSTADACIQLAAPNIVGKRSSEFSVGRFSPRKWETSNFIFFNLSVLIVFLVYRTNDTNFDKPLLCIARAITSSIILVRSQCFVLFIQRILFNPLRAKFFWGNINIYLHFMSFLHIDLTQALKILPRVREGPTYSADVLAT